ncbi:MAG: chorismate synthase [Candidatus Anstonellaceae archaeon]
MKVTKDEIQFFLDKRKPGAPISSGRREEDKLEVLEGIKGGMTDGGKITCFVCNKDAIPSHYLQFKSKPRPGHADYPAIVKYGGLQSGGGFFSGRMTVAFVIAGAIAKKLLAEENIKTMAFVKRIGKTEISRPISEEEIEKITYSNSVYTAAPEFVGKMVEEVMNAKKLGDSVGGIVECRIIGVPTGVGEPMFGSIESRLAQAIFAIPAVKGIEFGSGFAGSALLGSQNNDEYTIMDGRVVTKTNNCGGILGGLATGMPIIFRVAFKPTSSIFKTQNTIDLERKKEVKLKIVGRHDPCIAIRATPVVECVAAFTFADIILSSKEGKYES